MCTLFNFVNNLNLHVFFFGEGDGVVLLGACASVDCCLPVSADCLLVLSGSLLFDDLLCQMMQTAASRTITITIRNNMTPAMM